MNSVISILSNKNNIIMKVNEKATIYEIKKELKKRLPELKEFYKDAKNPILVTGKIFKSKEIDEIQDLIQDSIDVNVEFDIPKSLGLHGIKRDFKKEIDTSETKFYNASLRSGQRLEFEGSVVILGDVNSGAEIIAEDNIVVMGRLRGMAHAGARGNEKAIIAAHVIDSSQIRIASIIKERDRTQLENEMVSYAYVDDNNEIQME